MCKPTKLENVGPKFCPQGPQMAAYMVPRMTKRNEGINASECVCRPKFFLKMCMKA